jgi:hypothetical protein
VCVCGRKWDHLSGNPFLFSFWGMLMRVLLGVVSSLNIAIREWVTWHDDETLNPKPNPKNFVFPPFKGDIEVHLSILGVRIIKFTLLEKRGIHHLANFLGIEICLNPKPHKCHMVNMGFHCNTSKIFIMRIWMCCIENPYLPYGIHFLAPSFFLFFGNITIDPIAKLLQ